MKQGNTYRAVAEQNLDLHSLLPVGNYVIKMDQYENFYFELVESFVIGNKIYGDTTQKIDRIINTFNNRPNSTGVMFTGEKGSGKTLMAKALSVKCAEQNIPTIIINTPWHGDKFNTLMQSITQPCLICFDEFEKVYDNQQQTAVLTLLDGVFPSKKLFVLTCNDKWRIDEHMRNRPGRIFYMLDFKGLAIEFITEYCEENLNNKDQIENVCRVSSMFAEFNFDLLKALVEEMNRYNETAQEAIKMLNAKPQFDDGNARYNIEFKIGNNIIPLEHIYPKVWRGNPLATEKFTIAYNPTGADDDDDCCADDACAPPLRVISKSIEQLDTILGHASKELDLSKGKFYFSYLNLKTVDSVTNSYTYLNDNGATVRFTKIKSDFNYYAF
jgi:hypothetical protein